MCFNAYHIAEVIRRMLSLSTLPAPVGRDRFSAATTHGWELLSHIMFQRPQKCPVRFAFRLLWFAGSKNKVYLANEYPGLRLSKIAVKKCMFHCMKASRREHENTSSAPDMFFASPWVGSAIRYTERRLRKRHPSASGPEQRTLPRRFVTGYRCGCNIVIPPPRKRCQICDMVYKRNGMI